MDRAELLRWSIGAGIAAGVGVLGWLVRRFVAARLARWIGRTATDLDDALLAAASPQVPLWFLALGVSLGVRYARPDPSIVAHADRIAIAAFLLSVTIACSSLVSGLIAAQSKRWPGVLPGTTLIQNAARIVVIALGVLVVLGNLGIAIAPVLTALGVGSLAVALALQQTLSNVFAGLNITLARRIRVGDFLELETGQQGHVVDIGWRSTQIRELSNNLVIVPNARLAEVIVRNHSLPEGEQAALVEVGVAYESDLSEVERITVETARETQRSTPGAVADFEPFIRYHTLADSSINFTVILRVKEFVDRFVIMHEFIKRLHRRYAEAGIEIPFPQRVVRRRAEEERRS
jgi:small-conductance mechanosensitive channel